MGHFYPKNICKKFIDLMHEHKQASINDVCEECVRRRIKLSTATGKEDDPFSLKMALYEIVHFYLTPQKPRHNAKPHQIIIAAKKMTQEQVRLYNNFMLNDIDGWDAGDDGHGGEYGIFDNIQWKLSKVWNDQYPNVILLESVTL